MGTVVIILVIAAIAWVGYFVYQRFLGQQLQQPLRAVSAQHPMMLFQQGMAVGGGRGWNPTGSGTSLTINRASGRSALQFQLTPSGSGTEITATVTNIQKSSTLGVPTYPNANAILNKRRQVLAAMQ